jgi:hypothetical protein
VDEGIFDIAQGLWNAVLGKNFFLDARGGSNKILFPTCSTAEPEIVDTSTGIIYAQRQPVIRNRDRPVNATAHYADQALGGRPGQVRTLPHAITTNQTTRYDDVG